MASMLRSVDECFGRIIDELQRQGIADNTIVIFYSDNGGNTHSNMVEDGQEVSQRRLAKVGRLETAHQQRAPLRDGKGTLYEGGTRVPLLWSWANHIVPAARAMRSWDRSTSIPRCLICWGSKTCGAEVRRCQLYAKCSPEKVRCNARRTSNTIRTPERNELAAFGSVAAISNSFAGSATRRLTNVQSPRRPRRNDEPRGTATPTSVGIKLVDRPFSAGDTGATYPRPNPLTNGHRHEQDSCRCPRSLEATRLHGLNPRRDTHNEGTGAVGTAFLGHAAGNLTAPATVTLRVRSAIGGAARIDCLPQGTGNPDEKVSVRSTFLRATGSRRSKWN